MDKVIKPVEWTTRATKDLEKTARFYVDLLGKEKAKEIITTIRKKTEILEDKKIDLSKVGSIDETFNHLKYTYRKLIEHHCKITYREGKSKIYVVLVFDTRQKPKKNK